MKKSFTPLFLMILLLALPMVVSAQMESINNDPFTPENLITNIFLGEGVEVLDVQYDGTDDAVAYFKDGENAVSIERGLVMSTGNSSQQSGAVGVENFGNVQSSSGTSGSSIFDADIQTIAAGVTYNDVARYTITFIPISDTLRFNYVFGSEEYPEYVCSNFNDIFGFFISGPGINGPFENDAENIALIPGTDLPVRINNVNPGVVGSAGSIDNCTPPAGYLDYSEFYNDNNGMAQQPVFDGFTDVFTAEAVVVPCSTYTIKLVIADVGDSAFDSGVFLQAKSFGTGSLDVEATTVSLDGSVAEGCTEGLLSFVLPVRTEADLPLDYTILGTAENGVDYEFIPDDLFIPAGDSIVSVPIIAFEDMLDEGTETIMIDIQRDPCNRDTIIIPIKDNPLVPAELRPDTTVCQGDPVQLDGTLDVPLPEPLSFSNDGPLVVSPAQTTLYSDIDVFGVLPANLSDGVIESVCIDDLQTTWADDLKIFLLSPGGQFIELVTDIGNPGDNFIGTCFTPAATTPITDLTLADQPFTGEFAPEGIWTDLYGSENPTNGTWQLSLFDKFAADVPVLNSWTITFRPIYEIRYDWVPTTGLSCSDCPDPIATPDATTTYVMTATDSYGCTTYDSLTIEVIPDLEAPQAQCAVINENSITISWPDVVGANSYQVNVDNTGWVPANGMNEHTVNGIPLSTTVEFMIQGVALCPGAIDTIQCTTPDCTPPSLNLVSTSAVSCFGGADGAVEVSANGGVTPYEYNLEGQTNTTGIFTGLSAGDYTAQVLDSTGCPQILPFTISQPDSLDATLVKDDASCFGFDDGQATYEIVGGAGPYQFDWSDGQTDSIAVGLSAGMIELELTDANGCAYTYSIEIEEPALLEASVVVDSVDCQGDNTGSALITPEGGAAPYTYAFSPMVNQGATEAEAVDLARGTYSYTVTDANDCTVEGDFEIEEPEELEVTLDITDALCADSTSGSTIATVAGGIQPYTYLWQDEMTNTIGQTDEQTDMGAGFYQLEVTDANDCVVTASFEVLEAEALDYTLDLMPASCNGLADGQADITPSGGTGNYSFAWDDIGNGPASRTDLAGGSYGVTISDDNGCNLPLTFDIESPESIILAFDSTATSCNGGADGTAMVIPEGGTAPYSYAWEDGQNTAMASGLNAGSIGVTVTDNNGCEAIGNVIVEEATALSLELEGTDASCFEAADGQITATGDGGAGGYTFEWSDSQTGPTASGLSAGTYTVIMTDANGCTIEDMLQIEEPTALTSSTESQTASCNPTPDGTATIMADGGTMPYEYFWNDGQTTAMAQALEQGEYYVTVTDANGCTVLDTVQVDGIPEIELMATSEDVSCNGDADGQASINASGGSGVYTYSWGNGLPDSDTQNTLSANTYLVTVTDELGCMETISIEIGQPAALVLSTDVNMIRCSGGADGSAEVQPSGGTAPYIYNWSNGASSAMISDLALGAYSVTVEDANGCIISTTLQVEEASPISVTVEVEEVVCYGQRTGAAQIAVDGGLPPYTYSWSNGDTGNEVSNVAAGDYTVSITDAAGCEVIEELFIPQPDEPLSATISAIDVSCFGEQDGRIEIQAQGGTPGYRYSLDGEFYSGSSTFLGLEPGPYGVLVQDAEGCSILLDAVQVGEPDPIIVDLGEDRSINFGDTIRLLPEITGGVGAFGYDWFPQDSSLLSCFECSGPLVSPSFQVSYSVIVTDETGCTGEDLVTLYARKNRPVVVPTGFTPNGDGNNDILMVHAREDIKLTVTYFRVFDRWGELVFEVEEFLPNNPAFGWNGLFRDEPLNDGVFVWDIQVEYVDGLKENFKGHTTLVR